MEIETIEVPKEAFTKMLVDVETLIDDVEKVLEARVLQRRNDIEKGKITPGTEKELDAYLKKRGVKIE